MMLSNPHIRALFEANRRMNAESDMPIGVAVTFLGAAIWGYDRRARTEPVTIEGLAQRIGVPPTSCYTPINFLGDRYRGGHQGLGLVETAIDDDNRRRKVFFLTPRGRALADQLEFILSRNRSG